MELEGYEDIIDLNIATLSDFMTLPIIRNNQIAEVIVCWYLKDKPVRLIGFQTETSKSDFEIREEAFDYWIRLKAEVSKIKEG